MFFFNLEREKFIYGIFTEAATHHSFDLENVRDFTTSCLPLLLLGSPSGGGVADDEPRSSYNLYITIIKNHITVKLSKNKNKLTLNFEVMTRFAPGR